MKLETAVAVALLSVAGTVSAATRNTMTLAEAKRLSPQQLAERLLGAAAGTGRFVEAKVDGNGGVMIRLPGLNGIDLFRQPASAGFDGLCEVDGVHFEFSSSARNTTGDPPHSVTDFWKVRRFAMLAPRGGTSEQDERQQQRDCANLAPVVGRTDPVFFAVDNDQPVSAYFGMRAVAKAQAEAAALRKQMTCNADANDPTLCADPAAAVAAIPARRIHCMTVRRCDSGDGWCVHTIWEKSSNGKDPQMVELDIRTDATAIDPPSDFKVAAVSIKSGVWIVD